MSSLASESSTNTLHSSITKVVDVQFKLGHFSIFLAALIVFVLSIFTVGCNSIILATFYKYKRLRTASNCLLVSLAISDFGVGLFMPFGTYLELSDVLKAETGIRTVTSSLNLCVVPYCILIALCSVSVFVTVAIAVDRLTSLAQPLRYKNIITRSSIEKYIAVFWIYATVIGLSPLIYATIVDISQVYSGNCNFNGVIMPPVRIFLFLAVWAPSAFILLGCYVYVYLVARAHARAIYTVELSFRNQKQTLVLPRYGQTLAVTVGAFFILWIPFQICMLLDIFCGTNILSDSTIWLGLPILAHSGINPWIYAFHHGEMRIAASKITEDLVSLFGIMPSRQGCWLIRRGSNTNLELAEVNNINEEHRHHIENCFDTKQQSILYSSKRCLEVPSKNIDISPDSIIKSSPSKSYKQMNIVEEDIHDLKKMLDPKYVIVRNNVINSKLNVDKIKNFKYLLDPTFNKIRHLRRLNHKRLGGKNISRIHQSCFEPYQHLKNDEFLVRKTAVHLNTMSDPVLSTNAFNEDNFQQPFICKRKTSTLLSVSDSNLNDLIKSSDLISKLFNTNRNYGLVKHIIHNQHTEKRTRFFSWVRDRQRITAKYFESLTPTLDLKFQQTSYASLPTPNGCKYNYRCNLKQNTSTKYLTIIPNRMANILYLEQVEPINLYPSADSTTRLLYKNSDILKNSLTVPTIHSEPPSPIDPLPFDSLKEKNYSNFFSDLSYNINSKHPIKTRSIKPNLKSLTRYSDPIIPSVYLNIEDYNRLQSNQDIRCSNYCTMKKSKSINNPKLSNLLLNYNIEHQKNNQLTDPKFSKHKCTKFHLKQPSNSKWSEISRSQEILSNKIGSSQFTSYDMTCLDPLIHSNQLKSSFHESFLSDPSMSDSEDVYTSFQTNEVTKEKVSSRTLTSTTNVNTINSTSTLHNKVNMAIQSKSIESMFCDKNQTENLCTILRLDTHLNRRKAKIKSIVYKDSRLSQLTIPIKSNVCTPTFDITVTSDVKNEGSLGVKV